MLAAFSLAAISGAFADEQPPVGPASPPIECRADIHWDQNAKAWPGYRVTDLDGRHCVPFTATAVFPPDGYQGDYYADEFTDAKLRAAWAACVAAVKAAARRRSPMRAAWAATSSTAPPGPSIRGQGRCQWHGRSRGHPSAGLFCRRALCGTDRRGRSPPPSSSRCRSGRDQRNQISRRGRRHQLGSARLVHPGAGVDDGKGHKLNALVILSGGRSIETTAIQNPSDPLYTYNLATATYDAVPYPNATTEKWGVRQWREYIYKLNLAGFDVLTLDKRGHGISGGLQSSNTLQQARDLYRALDAFETGRGLRIMGADGRLLAGDSAAGILLRGVSAKEIPVIIGGASQGSMVNQSCHAHEFRGRLRFRLIGARLQNAARLQCEGAIVLAEFASGIGYRPQPGPLGEGALRARFNIAFIPSGEVLSGISKWPAVFFGRGLWDSYSPLEGTLDTYRRVTGLRELVVVRGPHSENESGTENVAHMQDRVVAFATSVIRGDRVVPGAARFSDLKSLVASSPAFWEPSMDPSKAP